MSDQRLIGAHLPAMHPARRETRPGRCSGCLARFAVDVRLPSPATCPDCGGDVVAAGEVEPVTRHLPFDGPRLPPGETTSSAVAACGPGPGDLDGRVRLAMARR